MLAALKLQSQKMCLRHVVPWCFRWRFAVGRLQVTLKETFWMACDCTEPLRSEYGPFHTRAEAETEARRLGFGFLLRYEHILGEREQVEEVRSIFLELPSGATEIVPPSRRFYTRCA